MKIGSTVWHRVTGDKYMVCGITEKSVTVRRLSDRRLGFYQAHVLTGFPNQAYVARHGNNGVECAIPLDMSDEPLCAIQDVGGMRYYVADDVTLIPTKACRCAAFYNPACPVPQHVERYVTEKKRGIVAPEGTWDAVKRNKIKNERRRK